MLGGVVYVAASIASSDALFAVAIGLVGVGLLVHLSDPVMYGDLVTAIGLVIAIAGAFTDAALTAAGNDGAATAVATAAVIVGVAISTASRKLLARRR